MPGPTTAVSATQTLIILFEQVITHIGGDDALLQKLEDAKTAFETEFKADETAAAALAGRVTNLETAPAVDLKPLAAAVSDLGSRVGSLETKAGDLDTRVKALEATPAGTDTALTDRVTALEQRNAADDAAAGGLTGAGGPAPAPAELTITGDIASLQVGVPFTGMLASDGVHPQFSVASGAIDGLSVAPGGSVSGTPTTAGSYSMVVQSHDDNGAVGSKTFEGTVADAAPAAGGVETLTGGNGADTINTGAETVNDPAGSNSINTGAGTDTV